MRMFVYTPFFLLLLSLGFGISARADENLLGYVKGAEPLPLGAWEIYQNTTMRTGKTVGSYRAWDLKTEVEYGFTDRLAVSGAFKTQAVSTQGLLVDGYLPEDRDFGLRPSGVELGTKYNFLSPAKDDIGFASALSLDYSWRDPHSGQGKDAVSMELNLIAQKYFLEGQLIWVGNFITETTHATRQGVDNLPPGFDWPTEPEIEWEIKIGTGLSYRFIPNWYLGAEAIYETELETEIGQERWSIFAGPSLHYGSEKWWGTLTWFPQIRGGGEVFTGQDPDLHVIEKTEHEVRLKIGLNF